jgi:hypothetical protein
MAKKKKRKFKNKSICLIDPAIIESDAFYDLSGKAAVVALIRFYQKVYRKKKDKRKNSFKNLIMTNNKQLIFTYGEAKELGIKSSRTFYRVIKELVEEKGFIDIEHRGNYHNNEPTLYAISERWRNYGTKNYKAVKIPRILPKGLGFQKQN